MDKPIVVSHLSQNLGRQKHMPTPQELARMQDDLSFKQTEMQKSEATASGLTGGTFPLFFHSFSSQLYYVSSSSS